MYIYKIKMATKVFSILGDMIDTDEKRAEVNDKLKDMHFEAYYDPLPILKEVEKWDTPNEKITDYERDFIEELKSGFKSFQKQLWWINDNSWSRPKYYLRNIIEWSSNDMGGDFAEAEKLVKEFRKEYKRDYSNSKKFDINNLHKLKNEIYDFYFNTRGFNRNNWV